MNIADQFLNKLGLTYEKLSPDEKETYLKMLEVSDAKPIEPSDLVSFLNDLITGIQNNLFDSKEGSIESITLKARLKNAIVLQSFLLSPQKAKEKLENYYKNFKL